jgi:hypothetical protein
MLARKRRPPNKPNQPLAFRQFGDFSSFSYSVANDKYVWTAHSRIKMRQYGLSESRVKRVIRFPTRYEEGIVPNTVAVMQPAGTQRYSEIWVMYKLVGGGQPVISKRQKIKPTGNKHTTPKKIRIITAWRYPGLSPKRDPIPQEILDEIASLL